MPLGIVSYAGFSSKVTLVIEVKADAVQEHNAEDAILSAWGVEVSVSGETLKLK